MNDVGRSLYVTGQYSTMTDHIYSALNHLEKEMEAGEDLQSNLQEIDKDQNLKSLIPAGAGKPHFTKLEKYVGRFKKNEMQPEIMRVFEKQVRGYALESYGLIEQAVEKELKNEHLSLGNRASLLEFLNKAKERILEISTQFYKIHPVDQYKDEAKSQVPKILLEEKSLIEKHIQIFVKEKLKGSKKLETASKVNLILKERIESIKLKRDTSPFRVSQEELTKLAELEKELIENQKEIANLRTFNELIDTKSSLLVDELNTVLSQIADIQGQVMKRLQPTEFLNFVGNQLSDSVLKDGSKELLDLSGAYSSQPALGKEMLANITTEILGLGKDLVIAKNKARKQVLKKRFKQILPFVVGYAIISIIYTHSAAILAGLGTAIAASKAFMFVAAALVGVTNPIGVMVLGGVVIFGLGILIARNKAHIVKLFTPIKAAGNYIAQASIKLFNIIQKKLKPNIHVHFKQRSVPNVDVELQRELRFVAENAKNHTLKSHLIQDIINLRKQVRLLNDKNAPIGQSLGNDLINIKKELVEKNKQLNLIEEELRIKALYNSAERIKYEISKIKLELAEIQKKVDSFPLKDGKTDTKNPAFKKLMQEKTQIELSLNRKKEQLKNLVGPQEAERMLSHVIKFHPRKIKR